MNYKLIAIDLDDTLLRNDLTISERAKEAIQRSMAQGTLVTFATGRMYRAALPYALELELDLPLITYQGALVKYVDGREVFHRPLDLAVAQEVINFIKSSGIHINAYIDDKLYMEEATHWGKEYASIAKTPINLLPLPQGLDRDPTKILLIGESQELDNMQERLAERFSDKVNLTKSQYRFLEISHPQATKGNALRELVKSLNIKSEEVMAIGDNLNDLDMLEYAGCGVAIGNAVEQVKNIADIVTKSNDDDGVAEIIEKMVLKC